MQFAALHVRCLFTRGESLDSSSSQCGREVRRAGRALARPTWKWSRLTGSRENSHASKQSRGSSRRRRVGYATTGDGSPPTLTREDFVRRQKQRTLAEVAQAGVRLGLDEAELHENFVQLDALLLDFTPDINLLTASDWALLASDTNALFAKLMLIKSYFPGVDLQRLVATNPKPLLKSKVALEEDLLNVRSMLAEAVNPDALVATLPILLEPKVLVSCLVTIQRWFPKKDPLEMLEDDPDMIRRAQEKDIPFDPVFFDGERWTAPGYDSKGKLLPWQKYIRKEVHKKQDVDDGSMWNGDWAAPSPKGFNKKS